MINTSKLRHDYCYSSIEVHDDTALMSSCSRIHYLLCSLEKTTIHDLESKATEQKTFRAGATTEPERRRGEYERDNGYTGTMYYAATQNMKKAEDRLLAVCPCAMNKQRTSNVQEEKGYVYILQS